MGKFFDLNECLEHANDEVIIICKKHTDTECEKICYKYAKICAAEIKKRNELQKKVKDCERQIAVLECEIETIAEQRNDFAARLRKVKEAFGSDE